MPEEKEYLTQEKLDELKKELEHLLGTRRKEIAEKLEYAKSLGDLSENAEYQEARENQAAAEERIRKLESILKAAIVISKRSGGAISIGSTAVIKKDGEKETRTYQIVGSEEADTSVGRISNKSPLGEALMGKSKGDKVTWNTPGGSFSCVLVDVE
ncbi:MAG: transcription elongation factor GreA [Candidatus Yonathbacteria bacterium RIFOXYC1_FULL_52_10]|uniref:Transcription elongation factor GreA n=1 Tax=Candidatus Yonathbacteria bacterium RIFOXYD1_FULL_52_36 TaxID=1802730 RepID=A0A1G2SI65_9BACT|nr:MAG: transcription elongation factor GreA [Candidatus Yonathbacteria bacterium RIFOXYD1_FULL_52_36]OHA84825.1 MAG: transcription elongation factor GreA [Candidatus Yonathbacteria bacterium RIFOXYC1_FULL_52_10]